MPSAASWVSPAVSSPVRMTPVSPKHASLHPHTPTEEGVFELWKTEKLSDRKGRGEAEGWASPSSVIPSPHPTPTPGASGLILTSELQQVLRSRNTERGGRRKVLKAGGNSGIWTPFYPPPPLLARAAWKPVEPTNPGVLKLRLMESFRDKKRLDRMKILSGPCSTASSDSEGSRLH